MSWELRDGNGSLFKNTRKEEDKHPDYRGEIMVGGQIYWLSAWIKEGKNGKFMSLSAKPKEDKAPEVKTTGGVAAMDEDVPF